MDADKLSAQIAIENGLQWHPGAGLESLGGLINQMINEDFNRLISILYRMDINEHQLKHLLAENNNTNAGLVIAHMMIERYAKKIADRKLFFGNNSGSEEEKW